MFDRETCWPRLFCPLITGIFFIHFIVDSNRRGSKWLNHVRPLHKNLPAAWRRAGATYYTLANTQEGAFKEGESVHWQARACQIFMTRWRIRYALPRYHAPANSQLHYATQHSPRTTSRTTRCSYAHELARLAHTHLCLLGTHEGTLFLDPPAVPPARLNQYGGDREGAGAAAKVPVHGHARPPGVQRDLDPVCLCLNCLMPISQVKI